jgi:glycosyltransferase involved in cell wall biosynthesis
MRTLVLFMSTTRGGNEEYALNVMRGLTSVGHEVHASFPLRAETTSLVGEVESQGVRFHPLRVAKSFRYSVGLWLQDCINYISVLRVLNKVQPDAVFIALASPVNFIGAVMACARHKTPTVIAIQLHRLRPYLGLRRTLIRLALNCRQTWFTVSRYNQKALADCFGTSGDKIKMIYNGIPAIVLTPEMIADARRRIRDSLDLHPQSRILLSVGRIHRQKGYDYLVDIMESLCRKYPDIVFVWTGAGPDREKLESKLVNQGVRHRLHIISDNESMISRDRVIDYLAAADLFVFPTRKEGLPLAVLEAMHARLPIVSSDATCMPEMITDGDSGLLFPAGDLDQFEAKISWALDHPSEMKEMAEKAYVQLSRFSQEAMLASIRHEIETIAMRNE